MSKALLDSFLAACLHFVWPLQCPLCGRVASVACPDCLDSLLTTPRHLCPVCHGPHPCRSHKDPPLLAGADHGGKARELLLLLKYRGRSSLGRPLGRALGRALFVPPADGLVPLPLHKGSPRTYNQALLIAKGLSLSWGLPVIDGLTWADRRPSQTGRSAAERCGLPTDALRWKTRTRPIRGRRLVVVDDVCTTGTTLDRARQTLEGEGASIVAFVVWTVTAKDRTQTPCGTAP